MDTPSEATTEDLSTTFSTVSISSSITEVDNNDIPQADGYPDIQCNSDDDTFDYGGYRSEEDFERYETESEKDFTACSADDCG